MSETRDNNRPQTRDRIRIPMPSAVERAESLLRLDDEKLAAEVPTAKNDTLPTLFAKMDRLAQKLLVHAPLHLEPEWLTEPARYRNLVVGLLTGTPEGASANAHEWIDQYLRLVALDIRAQRLGNLQHTESPFWREALQKEIEEQSNPDLRLEHARAIHTRAQSLYAEWAALPADERKARIQQVAIDRALRKFSLIRTHGAFPAKEYANVEEAQQDVRVVNAMDDDVRVLERFLQLVETSPAPTETTHSQVPDPEAFTADAPTEVTRRKPSTSPSTPPPRKSFLRRMFSPFAAAALFMLGLESAQDHESPHTSAATPENPTHETVRSEPVAVQTPAPTPEVAPTPAQNGPMMEDFHTVQKGERLWDIARQEIASERNIAPKRVHNQDILDRVKALEILNDIQNPKKLEIGERLNLRVPEPKMETPAPEPRTTRLASPRTTIESTASTSEAPHTSTVTASAKITRTAEPSANALPSAEKPHVIKSRGDTAWAHAQTLLQDGGVRSTTARRRLLAALMLEDSGKLNAYRLKIGQQLTTTRAEEAVAQLRAGKNPADIARSMGITWPVKGL